MKWGILNKDSVKDNDEIIKILLNNRGLKTLQEIADFLHPPDPANFTAADLGIDEKELAKAVNRIKKAVDEKEKIIVWGDYDADGICSTAIVWETLYKLIKTVLPYIPDRTSEGYGLNREAIAKLKAQNSNLKLIITVDHGITAKEKIEYAQEMGIDVIICDHHQLDGLIPKCEAVVHTDKICAAAIAWFLSSRILKEQNYPNYQLLITNYLDLVAIATVADLEPLLGVNRSFAKYGLEKLNQTTRCGLLAIFEEAGLTPGNLNTYEIGYIIGPRLNAAGRIEHALESLRLVCTPQKEQAKGLAVKLGLTNRERQTLTEETARHALESAQGKQSAKLLFVGHESYNQGIIGLVAGKLVEEFYRPAVVLSIGEIYSRASARSISGFNIIEAIRAQSDLLIDAGGHPMAAGFTVETVRIEELEKRLVLLAEKQITGDLLEKTLKIDMFLPLEVLSENLWAQIQTLAPFGMANPEPVFSGRATVRDFRTVGNEGKHLKLTVSDGQNNFSAIAFNRGSLASDLKTGREIEVAFTLILNDWNGRKNLELKIRDIK